MSKLFSEIAYDGEAMFEFERVYLSGKGIDCALAAAEVALSASEKEFLRTSLTGGKPIGRAAVHRLVTENLIAQIHGLWMLVENHGQDRRRYEGLYKEKMDEVAQLRTESIKRGILGKYRLKGPPAARADDEPPEDSGGEG